MTYSVLIVEDDFRVAQLHAAYTAAVPGFTIAGTASTGAEALAAAQQHAPDLALVDNYLPDQPGVRVTRQLPCDVIMVTADTAVRTVRAALSAGALNYLIKPFTAPQLQTRLSAYAHYRQLLAGDGELGQATLDRALVALRQVEQAPAPKGSSPVTARLVSDALRRADGAQTAAAVADALGVSRATAQRYLAALADEGHATVALRYGAAGRPEHLYTWRPSAG